MSPIRLENRDRFWQQKEGITEMEQNEKFESWAIVELMGHVKIAGRVSEEERFGAKMGRIEIPTATGFVTQWFSGGSVYRLTPTTEEIARAVATRNQPQPVHRWELPAPEAPPVYREEVVDQDEHDPNYPI